MKKNFKIPGAFCRAKGLALCMAVFAFCFSACSYSDNPVTIISTDAAYEESLAFISDSIPVFAPKERLTGSMSARFYNGDTYVPYVGLRYYLSVYMKYSVVSESYTRGDYRYVIQDSDAGKKKICHRREQRPGHDLHADIRRLSKHGPKRSRWLP